VGTENVRVRATNDGRGLAGQPLQAFIKKVLRWEKLMNLAARKKKSRALLEALLLEEELLDETLKDKDALERISVRLASYINLRAPNEAPLSCALEEDPEHNCYRLICTTRANGTGIRTVVDRELLSSPEYKELKRIFDELSGAGYPPFILENGDHSARLSSLKDLLQYIIEGGKKGQDIQRYKGLGEMNPDQLWETTMNPETRVLLQVRVEDAVEANDIFSTLMGDEVEPRRKFIEEHALTVKNLDV
jgi:DNA gyrase subunit B